MDVILTEMWLPAREKTRALRDQFRGFEIQ